MEAVDIPLEIREAYAIDEDLVVTKLAGGLVNSTYLIETERQKSILQQLALMFDAGVCEDSQVMSHHMAQNGWEVPLLIPSTANELTVTSRQGQLWRQQIHIASDGLAPQALTPAVTIQAATLLGEWHRSAATLPYVPQFELPHFHDSSYHLHKLGAYLLDLPTGVHDIAHAVIDTYSVLLNESDEPKQIIHGDPKLDNMLFRDGKPFTLIDFDTLMLGSAWVDVGDMFRSILGRQLSMHPKDVVAKETHVLTEAYSDSREDIRSRDQLYEFAMQATGRIALELAARYLNDIIDVNYFSWDETMNIPRYENHSNRARSQLKIAESALSFL